MLEETLALMQHGDLRPSSTLRLLLARPAWMADAACAEHPELPWIPEQGVKPAAVAAMRLVCASCLVRGDCLAYAVDGDEVGVWGGTSTRDRAGQRRAARLGHSRHALGGTAA